MLKNAPTLAIGGLRTAENEPPKICESPPKTCIKNTAELGINVYMNQRRVGCAADCRHSAAGCAGRLLGKTWLERSQLHA